MHDHPRGDQRGGRAAGRSRRDRGARTADPGGAGGAVAADRTGARVRARRRGRARRSPPRCSGSSAPASFLAELATTLVLPERTAGALVADAGTARRHPATLAALAAGAISLPQLRSIFETVTGLPADAAAALEAAALDRAPQQTNAALRRRLRTLRERLHPEPLDTRHRTATLDRRVVLEPAPDGMAWLSLYLHAERAHAITDRLHRLADTPTRTGGRDRGSPAPDPRTRAQRVLDTATDLLLAGVRTDHDGDPVDARRADRGPGAGHRPGAHPARPHRRTRRTRRVRTHPRRHRPTPRRARPLIPPHPHPPRDRRLPLLQPHHLPGPRRPGPLPPNPRRHLPVPRLRPPRHHLRPRPHHPLAPQRPHQPRQPRPPLPQPPPPQTPHPLADDPTPQRRHPLDLTHRPTPHHPPRTPLHPTTLRPAAAR